MTSKESELKKPSKPAEPSNGKRKTGIGPLVACTVYGILLGTLLAPFLEFKWPMISPGIGGCIGLFVGLLILAFRVSDDRES